MFRSLHVVIMQRRSLRRRLGQLEEQQDVESLLGRTAASPNVTRRGAGWFPTAPVDSDLGHGLSLPVACVPFVPALIFSLVSRLMLGTGDLERGTVVLGGDEEA